MEALFYLTVGLFLAASVHGYKKFPPTLEEPGICKWNMEPHHETVAQTTQSQFKFAVGSNCYKAGMKIPVSIVKVDSSSEHYFEGFLALARDTTNMNDTAVGTFGTKGDDKMKTLKCFTENDNAIGHKTEEHYPVKHFEWIAPAGFEESIQFQATIVRKKSEYWLGVMSDVIVYKADCAAVTTTTAATTTTTESAAASLHASILSMVVVACFTLFAR